MSRAIVARCIICGDVYMLTIPTGMTKPNPFVCKSCKSNQGVQNEETSSAHNQDGWRS